MYITFCARTTKVETLNVFFFLYRRLGRPGLLYIASAGIYSLRTHGLGRKEGKHFLVSDTQREKEKHCTIVFRLLKKERRVNNTFHSAARLYRTMKNAAMRKRHLLCGVVLLYYLLYVCYIFIPNAVLYIVI